MHYIEIPIFTKAQGIEILASEDREKKILYLLSLGKYCKDYEYSIKTLKEYLYNQDEDLVACALQSLEYIVYDTENIELNIIKTLPLFLQSNNKKIYGCTESLLLEISHQIPKYKKLVYNILKKGGSEKYKKEYFG